MSMKRKLHIKKRERLLREAEEILLERDLAKQFEFLRRNNRFKPEILRKPRLGDAPVPLVIPPAQSVESGGSYV
jgi:hypothetical protein